MSRKGRFVVFEGLDHSGKTSQVTYGMDYLRSMKLPVFQYREPGGTQVGERIREVLLDRSSVIYPKTELMMFFAARMQLLLEHIEPALEAEKIVVLDRYYYSTAAYQGPFLNDILSPNVNGASLVLDLVKLLHLPEPDLVVYLDGDPELLAKRANPSENDRIEAKGIEYQKKVRETYLHMASLRRGHFKTVDAMRPIDDVWNSVRTYLDLLIGTGA